jgi:hypothetical protein
MANMKKTSIFIQKTCFNAEIEIQINLPVLQKIHFVRIWFFGSLVLEI